MAYDYEKQQPQLNGGYYGPPIPPQPLQPAHYGPGRCRRCPSFCICCLFKVVATVIIVLGIASLVLWLIFRPQEVKAYATSAALSRFDLAGGRGPKGADLQYNLTVDILVRNPNRFGINYEYVEAKALYHGEAFGSYVVRSFYQGRKSDETIRAVFNGSLDHQLEDDVERTYLREKAERSYHIEVKVYATLEFKVRVFEVRDYKSKISCMLPLPVPAAGKANSTEMTDLWTKCDVDF